MTAATGPGRGGAPVSVRPPAVAGSFYPGSADALVSAVREMELLKSKIDAVAAAVFGAVLGEVCARDQWRRRDGRDFHSG